MFGPTNYEEYNEDDYNYMKKVYKAKDRRNDKPFVKLDHLKLFIYYSEFHYIIGKNLVLSHPMDFIS